MERVGILVVSYGGRGAAIVDSLCRSLNYRVEVYIVDRQKNPFNAKKATEHVVVPDLNVKLISRFAERRQHRIDFGIVGPEKPIIDGLRDAIESKTSIRMICPTREFAIESSKVAQRLLFEEIVPMVNPRFRIFDPKDYRNTASVKKDAFAWFSHLENRAVVKPDVPAAGKGVGVWGDHFETREQMFEHFLANFKHGKVIVEEKIEGEESSFQALCDGKRLAPLPETRDYKRAFEGDEGPNTGGMGSYKGEEDLLPFMSMRDREKEIEIVTKIFQEMKKQGSGTELRGVPFYVAFVHTAEGPKILENNSRPGDPEIINILPLIKDDFADVCFKIVEGTLSKVEVQSKPSVVIYKVPPSYGGYSDRFKENVKLEEIGLPVNLKEAYKLERKMKDNVRVYPAAMELRNGQVYALSSRSVAVLGIADSIEEARRLSMKMTKAIHGGALWNRNDIASVAHIKDSMEHMEELRRKTA